MLSEEEEEFDVIIVGGGPAGLNAAIMCDTRHLRVLLLEKDTLGGLLASLYPTKTIPNYPGFPEITAIEFEKLAGKFEVQRRYCEERGSSQYD